MHSDGGGQYYCNEFKSLTKELGMINSMTEEKVYENSHAERLNGIIKNTIFILMVLQAWILLRSY